MHQLRIYLLACAAALFAAACGGVSDCPPGTFASSGGVCQLSDAGPMCAGNAPFELEGVCVECLLDAQCTTGVCGNDHVCAECADATDCPSERPVCNDVFECVECLTSAQCADPGRPLCSNSVCVACDGDATCLEAELPYCLPDLSACVACAADTACPDGRCEPTAHECVDCLENTDCEGDAPFCSGSNSCVACLGDSDCTDEGAPFCSPAGACVPCLTDANCTDANAPWCDLDTNACVECLTNDHCPGAAASECSAEGSCGLCTQPTSCSHIVETPQCSGSAAGCVECRPTEGDCGSYSCSPTTFECTDTLLGSVGLCESCVNSSECATGACVFDSFAGGGNAGYCLPVRATPEASCPPVYQTRRSGLDTTGATRDYCRPMVSCGNVRELYNLLDPTMPVVNCERDTACHPLNRCTSVAGYSGKVCTVICSSPLDCPAELGGGACEPLGAGRVCNGG